MLDSTTSQCVPCPVGAICGDNNIIGNQQGYWESPQGNFYLCSESLLPNPDEISAANEACPALSSVCGTGYTGPICLTCSDSYGTFGPYCRQCPNPAISWVTVLICSILVLLLATFMIYQTQTESYKEAISVKILITHIQMLAIISVLSTWTEPFLGYLSIGAMALWIRNRLLYLDCLFSGTSFYSVFAGYMLFPIFAILLIVLIYTIIFLIVYRNSSNFFHSFFFKKHIF